MASPKKRNAFFFAVATTLLFIFLPGGKSAVYRFEIRGEAFQLQNIPHLLEEEAKKAGLFVKCSSETIPTRVRCQQSRLRFSDQKKLDQLFSKNLPDRKSVV